MQVIPVDDSTGLVTFPSFHTMLGLVLIWAVRKTVLFWPSLFLNGAMVVSTVAIGGHYLIDVVAGIVLTAMLCAGYKLLLAPPTEWIVLREGLPLAAAKERLAQWAGIGDLPKQQTR
jgi:membrane-associated phospholipid phosphatase